MSYFYTLIAFVLLGTACVGDWSKNDKKQLGTLTLIFIALAGGHRACEQTGELKDRIATLERKVRKYDEST